MVDKKPDRQLRRDRQDVGDRQRKAELDKADAECRLQKREQRRQDEIMEMIDEMRRRDDADGAVFPALLAPFATTPIIASATDGCRVRRHQRSASRGRAAQNIGSNADPTSARSTKLTCPSANAGTAAG